LNDITAGKQSKTNSDIETTLAVISRDAVIITDKKLNIIRWKKAAETIFGWKVEEATDKLPFLQVRAKVLNLLTRDEVMKGVTEKGSWSGEATT
jgi:PAS domain-containing protein